MAIVPTTRTKSVVRRFVCARQRAENRSSNAWPFSKSRSSFCSKGSIYFGRLGGGSAFLAGVRSLPGLLIPLGGGVPAAGAEFVQVLFIGLRTHDPFHGKMARGVESLRTRNVHAAPPDIE